MKAQHKILMYAMTGMMLWVAPSCSFIKTTTNKITGSSGQITSQRTVADKSNQKVLTPPQNTTSKKAAAPAEEPKGVKKSQQVTPEKPSKSKTPTIPRQANIRRPLKDSLQIAKVVEQRTEVYNPNYDKNFSINGEWTIYSVRGNVVTGEERPYITFDLPANRFYGNNGCNYINGDILLGENGALKLDNMITTMKMCGDAEFEYVINLAVSDVKAYSARVDGPITFLDLLNGHSTKPVLVLRRHNMDFLNGAWKVDSLNGTPVESDDDNTPSLTINVADLQIHGTTGCNRLSGKLFIDPDKQHSLQIVDVLTTKMMCSPESRETEFLLALESVESAKLIGKDRVELTSPNGTVLFTLSRIPLDK